MSDIPSEAEQRISEAFTAGNMEVAASAAIEAYGDQILSFIASRLKNRGDAEEVFSMFGEDLWLGLPKFAWRCSMRTWCYTLARNAVTRFATAPARRGARNIPLSYAEIASGLTNALRNTTQRYQQTAVKDRFRALREQLDADDQLLLVLRVDRGLSWQDLAMAINGDVDLSDELIARESARLRKAFERVKAQLKRLAQQEGLLDKPED